MLRSITHARSPFDKLPLPRPPDSCTPAPKWGFQDRKQDMMHFPLHGYAKDSPELLRVVQILEATADEQFPIPQESQISGAEEWALTGIG